MHAQLVEFGTLELCETRYDHDLVVEAGEIRKRDKDPSRSRKGEFGHTPLTSKEDLPWGTDELIVGTGVLGALPITEDVYEEARKRGIEVRDMLTEQACRSLHQRNRDKVFAVLHSTC